MSQATKPRAGRAVAEASLAAAVALQRAGPAAAAEFLYEALEALDTLTGQDTRESVLDRLFQRFCVGK
jgi:tRNA U34 5-carboxymethylaminomethyl modifying GTPase MnmE/TrmE